MQIISPTPRKLPPEVAGRAAGKYRVAGPGSVIFHGRQYLPGCTLHLDADDARSLGDTVEPVPTPTPKEKKK